MERKWSDLVELLELVARIVADQRLPPQVVTRLQERSREIEREMHGLSRARSRSLGLGRGRRQGGGGSGKVRVRGGHLADEECEVRLVDRDQLGQRGHQRCVVLHPAGRVDQNHVRPGLDRRLVVLVIRVPQRRLP